MNMREVHWMMDKVILDMEFENSIEGRYRLAKEYRVLSNMLTRKRAGAECTIKKLKEEQ